MVMFKRPAFSLDVGICTGCKTCIVACKDKNNLGKGIRWRRVYEYSGGEWVSEVDGTFRQNVASHYISMSCNHCSSPVCVVICPVGAMSQDEHGIVIVDESTCTGCRKCEDVCPYSAPQYSAEEGVVTKCDFCRSELETGGVPACVAACPTRALSFGELAEIQDEPGSSKTIYTLPNNKPTGSSTCFTRADRRRPAGGAAEQISNMEEIEDL